MTLSRCLRRAGESIAREDKVAILAKAKELRESGLENAAAARKAVQSIMGEAKATLSGMTEKLGLNPKPAKPAFSRKEDKPFYSALARGIEGINAKSQPAEGWRAQIQGLINKGSVKADEYEWSGLGDWLRMKSGKVSKQEVQDFIAANGVQVHEVTKGSAPDIEAVSRDYRAAMQRQGASFDEAKQMIAQMRNFAEDKPYDEKQSDKGFALVMKDGTWTGNEIHDATTQSGGSTKYEKYNLPGGKNYRELLLTLPVKQGEPARFQVKDESGKTIGAPHETRERAQDFIDRNRAHFDGDLRIEGIGNKSLGDAYKSKHWDEPNVLAHIRLDDRTDADGKKVLMVQELQSDWAQQGRKDGFVGDKLAHDSLPDGYAVRTRKEDGDANITRYWVEDPSGRRVSSDHYNRDSAVNSVINDLNDQARGTNASPVPRAPFVDSTDKWLPLALKRVMKMAAADGYDRVAFVTGAQAAERFSLDKHLDQIRYDDAHAAKKSDFDQNAPEGHGRLMGYDRNGDLVIDKRVGHDELPEHVGKEISDRLLAQPAQYRDEGYNGHVRRRVLQGAGLKVEAKGMRGFYDDIVPATLNKLLPKFGGGKVGEFEIDHEGNTAKVGDPDEAWPFEVWRNGRVINRHATRAYAEEELQEFRDRDARNGETDPTLRIEQVKGTTIKQPGFDVTDAMREKTAGGVPMFSRKEGKEESPDDGAVEREKRVRLAEEDYRLPNIGNAVPKEYVPPQARLKEVTIYRGVPSNRTDATIRPGDWVTLNRAYASIHGSGETGATRVISMKVPADHVAWAGTDMNEWFYAPRDNEPKFSAKSEEERRQSHGFHTREIQVDGKWRPIEDSSGRLLARGDFRGQQNFYKWFADSQVTDSRGRPLLVFHGTGGDFDAFKKGGYFTPDAGYASQYADGDAPNVKPVYLSLRKPLDLRGDGAQELSAAEMAEILDGHRVPVDEDVLSTGDYQPAWLWMRDARLRSAVEAAGYDGIIQRENNNAGEADAYIAFHPEQIKSAIGNVGTYDGSNPDIRFARKGTTAATANLPPSAPLGTWERSKSVVSDLIDEGLTKSGVYKFTSPMSEGSTRAKAIAQNFANAERQARREWTRVQEVISKDFPDKTVREKMWNAADQENEILSGRLAPSASVGLASLTPRQRDVVEQLHAYGEELLQRAKDVGMFSGDGVPYWTPRMMVMLDANGEYTRPVEPGKKETSGGDGRNVFVSSSNLKQRKYLTSAETEAAMQSKGGELVRDITTMPMAMQRLERAIAGRELINQIKDLGRATGTATVSNSMHEGFFTLDHAAFTRFQPRMEKDPITGKSVPMQDSHGNIILDRVPLYMSREFEGPIKAILSNTDGTAYRAYMLLKSKAMSAIMFSPLIHNMVIFGRALGYDPTFAGTIGLYVKGFAARKDDALVRAAIDGGLVPMGHNKAGMIDVTDVARGIGREGGWGDPNESWIALGSKAIIGAVNKDAGAAAKRFVDKAGDIWHGDLLWERVADLQMGIFQHAYERLQSEGFDPKVAAVMAAHWGNRYAGAVGRENMGEYARKAANVLLFSRSFNAGNLGTIKDLVYGMPAGLRAKLEFENGKGAAGQAYTEARKKAIGGFIADAALSLIALSAVQSLWVDKYKKDKSWQEIFGGYMDRAGRMGEEIKRHPLTPKSYSPWQLSPTHDNEPGKQDRIDMGEIPGAGGRHEYMRLPTGKVVEDLFNWTMHPAETFSAKMSPLAKAAWQIVSNDKGFGVPVYDPDGSMAGFGMDVAKHLAKAQTPWDTIVTAWDKTRGRTTPIEDAKLLGNVTGFSASQGHPQGPEAGVAAELEERMRAKRLLATEEVKRLLKYDDEDKARQKLEDAGFTPREVTQIIKKIESPREGMSPTQRRKFNSHSSEEDQQRMDRVTR